MAEPAITVLIVMQSYIKFALELLKNIRVQLLIGVISFFIIALILSTYAGQVYLILWLVVGAFTLYFIRLTFPDVWNYVFWLMGIFFLNFLAVLCLLQTKFTSHPLFFAIGIFLELVTLGIFILLILHFKAIRDDISGVTDRPEGLELQHEAAYVPLGLWSLSVFLFWFVSNLSILYWYDWSVGGSGPEAYLASEIVLLIILVFILWHPQMNFDWGLEPALLQPKATTTGAGILERGSGFLPRFKKIVRATSGLPKKCPICGSKIVTEHRECKSCGQKRVFAWCKISEGYIVTCPHCRTQTSYGKIGCINCGKPINRTVRCTCGSEHEIRDWKFLKTVS
jgi:hypothetical protein